MKERDYNEILDFFREILKIEIDDSTKSLFNKINHIKSNDKFANNMKNTFPKRYNNYNKLANMDIETQQSLFNVVQEEISDAFLYFFKRLEEGENIEQGERINFELTAVNENTGQRTKLISATPDEDEIDNDFQEWIMENCSKID